VFNARAYVGVFLLAATLVAGAPLLLNWHVDPYRLRESAQDSVPMPNTILHDERTAKILRARNLKADVVLLGTSRMAVGGTTDPAQWSGKRVYNLGFGGQTWHETRLLVEHVVPGTGARTLVVGLDFFAANVRFAGKEELTAHLVTGSRLALAMECLASWDTSKHSVAILRGEAGDPNRVGVYVPATGSLVWSDVNIRTRGGHHALFLESETAYATHNYRPPPTHGFSLVDERRGRSAEDELRRIVRAGYKDDMELVLFVSPSHARQWTLLSALGLWDQFEAWKRMLARVVEEEAARAGKAVFPLWDFADYSAPTTEKLPRAGALDQAMRHYWDSSHYRPTLGTEVLKRMRGDAAADAAFGAKLTSDGMDAHLARIRGARTHYEQEHAGDVAEIAALAAKSVKERPAPLSATAARNGR
jgi:hypothetical protein